MAHFTSKTIKLTHNIISIIISDFFVLFLYDFQAKIVLIKICLISLDFVWTKLIYVRFILCSGIAVKVFIDVLSLMCTWLRTRSVKRPEIMFPQFVFLLFSQMQ